MVEEIYRLKNTILRQVEKEIEDRGVERMDVDRIGEMVDMVKDLAKAESACQQAQYYKAVTEAMGSSRQGYQMPGDRYGYAPGTGGTGSSAGYSQMGYGAMGHDDVIEKVRVALRTTSPDEREKLRKELASMTMGA